MYISHRPGRQRGGGQEEGGAGFHHMIMMIMMIMIIIIIIIMTIMTMIMIMTTRRRARGRKSRFSHLSSIIFEDRNYQICLMKRIEGDYADHNLAGSAQPRSLLNGQRLLESSLSKCSNFVSSSFGCLFVGGLKINITNTI